MAKRKIFRDPNQGTPIHRGAGIMMFTLNYNVYLIQLKTPYPNTFIGPNIEGFPHSYKILSENPKKDDNFYKYEFINFTEKLAIPRGKVSKRQPEDLIITALREFCEETQLDINCDVMIYNRSHQLEWRDAGSSNNTLYSYTIFVGFLPKSVYYTNLISELNLSKMDEQGIYKLSKVKKTNFYEAKNHLVCTMHFQDYQRFMKTNQLQCYKEHGYEEFFNFVSRIVIRKKEKKFKLFDYTPDIFQTDEEGFFNIKIKRSY